MKTIFKYNKVFILPYLLLFLVAIFIISSTKKIELHSFFNMLVTNSLNPFFKYITYLGDGLIVILFIVLLLLYSVQKSVTIFFAYISSAIFTQVLKHTFFTQVDRPVFVFQEKGIPLNLVKGVDMYVVNSFPSGHATAAFSMFFCLSFFSTNNLAKIGCLAAALVICFSRVYLSQHFFEDITAGSFIGVVFAWLTCFYLYQTKLTPKFNELNKPIWKLF